MLQLKRGSRETREVKQENPWRTPHGKTTWAIDRDEGGASDSLDPECTGHMQEFSALDHTLRRQVGFSGISTLSLSPSPLRLDDLKALVAEGSVDTVIVALTDMQGRLQGKRCSARYFLDEVVPNTIEACSCLLAVDVEMRTVGGYSMSSWERGYGDFVMRPDFGTLRTLPWSPGTTLVLCDLEWEDRTPVSPSPRQVLKQQITRLKERGLVAYVGTELEFIVFNESYEEAWRLGYDNLTPANLYNVDYSIVGTGRVERLLRRIRNEMAGANMYVESAKGECNLGQHEVAFRYSDALTTCDNHVIYKTGAKEIAHQEGMSLTFMPKWDGRGAIPVTSISVSGPPRAPLLWLEMASTGSRP